MHRTDFELHRCAARRRWSSSRRAAAAALAEEIAVGNYGVSANGMPFGVALVKGYFKDEGLNITGLISSAGGGTSLRNMLAGGGVPYGEVNPGVVVSAILAGADLQDRQRQRADRRRVRLGGEAGLADQDDQGLQGQEDRLHQSALDQPGARHAAAADGGYKPEDAELVKTGGFGEGIAALDAGLIDVAPITEPLWSKVKDKYRARRRRERGAAAARQRRRRDDGRDDGKERGDFIRAVIRARRKAVQVHDRASRRGRRDRRQAVQHRASKSRERRAQPDDEHDQGRAVLGRRRDPPRGLEADDRGAALGRRDHGRGRLQQDHRHAVPARRSEGDPSSVAASGDARWTSRASVLRCATSARSSPRASSRPPLHALGPIDLEFERGEFFAVVGPSGCGKSTLLELIAGLTPPTEGTIEFEGRPIARRGARRHRRRVPGRRVASLAQRRATTSPSACAARTRALPRRPSACTNVLQARRPLRFRDQLSGAALGRHAPARVHRAHAGDAAALILLDEPFGALDQQTRLLMGDEVLRMWRETGRPCS